MAVGTSQVLSVANSIEGRIYTWELSGGGSLSGSTGLSVTYTAPSTNANCASNATITISCGGVACNALQIAINSVETASQLAARATLGLHGVCTSDGAGGYMCRGGSCPVYCNGTVDIVCSGYLPCTVTVTCGPGNIGVQCTDECIEDVRSAEQKAAGCCPNQLL